MTPTLWDHGFVVVLLFAIPIYGRIEYQRLVRRFLAGEETSREEMYRSTIGLQWLLVAVLGLVWVLHGRGPAELGLQLRFNAETVLGAAICAGGLALLCAQRFAVRRLGAESRARLRAQFARTWALLPANARELAWFRGLAVTAGICEELLYRGYLIPYAGAYFGESASVLVAAAAFGIGHYYQGVRGVLKTGLVGVAAGWLYMKTESLLWPMILHVALDLQSGATGRALMADGPATERA